jgi:alcohol dehydrogenase class IV
LAPPSTFSAGTEVISGLGSLDQLRPEADRLGMRRAAVVCDDGVASAGLLDSIVDRLGSDRVAARLLVKPDPSIDDSEAAARLAREAGADSVLMIGGGSGLAVGKAVAVRLSLDRPLSALAAGPPASTPDPAPTLAIPTTAGSGSEVSSVFVLRDPGRPAAVVFRGRGYGPRVTLLDATVLRSLPREPMVFAALDSLSHSLEALWTHGASRFTDALARAAADDVFATLPSALAERGETSLQTLLEASAMANLACGSSGLGLVHALSLATAVRLPHGYQNGVLLPAVAAFNYPYLRPDVRARVDRLERLYAEIGVSDRFRAGELDVAGAAAMAAVALASPLHANNVRAATPDDVRAILARVGAPVSDTRLPPSSE